MTEQAKEPTSYIDYQQLRGAGWDVVDEAIQAYDDWLLDDDYDAVSKLAEIMVQMRARRDLYRDAPPSPQWRRSHD